MDQRRMPDDPMLLWRIGKGDLWLVVGVDADAGREGGARRAALREGHMNLPARLASRYLPSTA
jgi:hypothetical protein